METMRSMFNKHEHRTNLSQSLPAFPVMPDMSDLGREFTGMKELGPGQT